MEFVFVSFPTRRRVDMDGQQFGLTQRVLKVPPGHHTFDLGMPRDYTPVFQNVEVVNTSAQTPLDVAFRPLVAALTAVGAGAPLMTRARKKAARKKPSKKKAKGRKKAPRKPSTSKRRGRRRPARAR